MVRGPGYSARELRVLLDIMEEILPIGNDEWEQVKTAHYETMIEEIGHDVAQERSIDSIKCKFASLHNNKKPTGDPTCPPEVCQAKYIHRLIQEKYDHSDAERDLNNPSPADSPIEGYEDVNSDDDAPPLPPLPPVPPRNV